MNAYDSFASAYDALNTEIDYGEMADFISRRFAGAQIAPGSLVLDLGCGTGSLTRLLAERGYDMIGIDGSEEMLACARQKGGDGVLYLEQELDGFELYGTVAAIVSTTDTINHIIDGDGLRRVFRLAHNYTDPGGLFIFDLNSPLKFETVYGGRDYVLEDDGVFLSWQTEYDPETRLADFFITLFEEQEGGEWERTDAQFSERCRDTKEITALLAECGFETLFVGDGYGGGEANDNTLRTVFVAKRDEIPAKDQKIGL